MAQRNVPMERARRVAGHIQSAQAPGGAAAEPAAAASHGDRIASSQAKSNLKKNGWGFDDTEFVLNDRGEVALSGSRYLFSGQELPSLRTWMEENAGLDISMATPAQRECRAPAPPIRNEAFLEEINGKYKSISFDDQERVFHAHGHTAQEIFLLRYGKFPRVPDVVIWPGSHEDCVALVEAATKHNVVIIPYGGGTTVTQALLCPVNENRMIVSVDMHRMNRIKWINRESMLACIEAGIVGKDLERKLAPYGLVLGHEPDSSEFSTLGGWVATRASGMRKNRYGNIEDIVRKIKVVTPSGTFQKAVAVPRLSAGPDLHDVFLGSEGTLGLVTEVTVRLRPAAECTKYGSLIFPDFESGVACLHEVAMKRMAPVSIRLVDNMQFQFGQALKPAVKDWKQNLIDKAKKWYVLNRLKFEPEKMVAATLLFEGSKAEVARQETALYKLAAKYGGMKAGEENGIRGYFLTYMIAYLRDFGYNYSFLAESFETSVPWDNVATLCASVKARIFAEAEANGVTGQPFVSCRVTQLYDTGACVYFYFGFVWHGLDDPIGVFSKVEHGAREEIMALGGSISHHHGIGKLRKGFLPQTVGSTGMKLLRGIKQTIDPKNIFGNGNLGLDGNDEQAHGGGGGGGGGGH